MDRAMQQPSKKTQSSVFPRARLGIWALRGLALVTLACCAFYVDCFVDVARLTLGSGSTVTALLVGLGLAAFIGVLPICVLVSATHDLAQGERFTLIVKTVASGVWLGYTTGIAVAVQALGFWGGPCYNGANPLHSCGQDNFWWQAASYTLVALFALAAFTLVLAPLILWFSSRGVVRENQPLLAVALLHRRVTQSLAAALLLALAGMVSVLIQMWIDGLGSNEIGIDLVVISAAWYSLAVAVLLWGLSFNRRGRYLGACWCSHIAGCLAGLSALVAPLWAWFIRGINAPIYIAGAPEHCDSACMSATPLEPVTGIVLAAFLFGLAAVASFYAGHVASVSGNGLTDRRTGTPPPLRNDESQEAAANSPVVPGVNMPCGICRGTITEPVTHCPKCGRMLSNKEQCTLAGLIARASS